MIGKNTYFAMRKSVKGSVTAENRLGSLLNGTAAFSVDAMVRVMELTTDKSVLKIEGIIDFGIHENGIYVKLPGYPGYLLEQLTGDVKDRGMVPYRHDYRWKQGVPVSGGEL